MSDKLLAAIRRIRENEKDPALRQALDRIATDAPLVGRLAAILEKAKPAAKPNDILVNRAKGQGWRVLKGGATTREFYIEHPHMDGRGIFNKWFEDEDSAWRAVLARIKREIH